MPYLRKGELLPVKGFDLSIPSLYLKEGYGSPINMQYARGQMRKRDGKSQFGKPSIGNINFLHMDSFRLSTMIQRLIAHTKRHVYEYVTGSDSFNDLTGINDLTGGDTDYFDSCTVPEFDWYLFTNYVDNIRKITDVGNSANLGGNPPKARCIEYMTPYVFIANLNDGGLAIPTKGAWCDTGDPETWIGNNAGSHLFTDDTTEIQRVKKMGEYLFVYKAGMTYRGWLVATADVFNFITHSMDRGLYSPRALVDADGKHFYMGTSDFHTNNGVRIDDIGGPIREFVFNRLNRSAYKSCFAMMVDEFKEVWFFVTVTGNDYPTEVWKYKYDLGFWYMDTVENVLCGTNYKRTSDIRWIDLIGTWLEQNWKWSDQSGQADTPFQVFGNDSGICLKRDPRSFIDGTDVYTARQETRDYCGLGDSGQIGIEDDQEWYQLDFWASGSSVDIYYSLDEGSTWKYIKTKTLTQKMEKHSVFFDVISPTIRFRFENLDPMGYFTFRSLIPYYLSSGNLEKP
jgi:hypothetical protein